LRTNLTESKGDEAMKQLIKPLAVLAAYALLAAPRLAAAQVASAIPPAITTPDTVETRVGTMECKDGMPSQSTVDKVYDHLDFTHAFEAFENTMQGVSVAAIRKGFLSIGVKDNEILIFSELMDAKSLFLTANADTIYFLGFIDLSKGPMVVDRPQRFPRAGSQSYPSPAAEPNADGSITVYFGPKQPDGVKRGNWIQTIPNKGWFVILRLYSPLEPFFDKSWRPSEIELVP
jgi:hypothetical protein